MGQVFSGGSASGASNSIVQAALLKNVDEVKKLLETGTDPAFRDHEGNTGLGAAACSGSLECVNLLLATGRADPAAKNNMGCSPCWLAAGYGHLDILEVLLALEGVDPNAPNAQGDSPLAAAASRGHAKIMLRLLECPTIDAAATNAAGDSALAVAAARALPEVVDKMLTLVEEGPLGPPAAAELASRASSKGISPLGAACAYGGAPELAAATVTVLTKRFQISSSSPPSPTASLAPFLHQDANGATPLMVAAHCANAAATKALLGALQQATSQDSSSPSSSEKEGVQEVLEATDLQGATALWLAAASLKPQGGGGGVAALSSGQTESKEVVEALLAAGADPKGGSPGGITAQAAAERNGQADIAALLAA